ncbi:hypothetical protein IKE82_01795 [Candidatus Saccharibacteria bacterium]|nr:hypothetical protein [Candidatus Saccharibacteria bacterium]
MTKKYMDFAPKSRSRTAATPVRKPTTARSVAGAARANVGAVRPATGTPRANVGAARPAIRVTKTGVGAARATTGVVKSTVRVATKPNARVIRSKTVSRSTSVKKPTGMKLGEIEDVNPKFVMTNVPKRALGSTTVSRTVTATATMAKAQKVGSRAKVSKKVDNSSKMKIANEKKKTYMMPRVPFINQDKVAKRPLSKNVYKKQLDALEKATSGVNGATKASAPVTIISKPEKDSKVGVVVTIVLTIILGAVAGTVAFLLLPK